MEEINYCEMKKSCIVGDKIEFTYRSSEKLVGIVTYNSQREIVVAIPSSDIYPERFVGWESVSDWKVIEPGPFAGISD